MSINYDLSAIKPLWYTKFNEIRLLKTKYSLPDPRHEFIIENVNIDKLINMLVCGNQTILREPGLYKKSFYKEKTNNILELWSNGKRIIPPSISISSDGLIIEDGRHRINVSIYLQEKTMPILVSLNQSSKIIELLF